MPRRLKRKSKGRRAPAKTREPLAEGIRKRRPKGFFTKMSDDKLVGYAKRFMRENGISGRSELQKADGGLYTTLQKRKLLEKVKFEEKQRDWSSFSDAQLVEHTRKFMKKRGISGRSELSKADKGWYTALQRRKLLERIGFEEKVRNWSLFSDTQLVEHARKFMKEKGIRRKYELQNADSGLYTTLYNRKLIDRIGFEERKRRDWNSLSDAQLVEHARKFLEEKGIRRRTALKKVDGGFYFTLRKRKLLDWVFEDIEKTKEREEAQALFDGLMEFGGAQ